MSDVTWTDIVVFIGSVTISIISSLITFRVRFERMEAMDAQRTADRKELETRLLAEAAVQRAAQESRLATLEMQFRTHEHLSDARWLEFGKDHGKVLATQESLAQRLDRVERDSRRHSRDDDDSGRYKKPVG